MLIAHRGRLISYAAGIGAVRYALRCGSDRDRHWLKGRRQYQGRHVRRLPEKGAAGIHPVVKEYQSV